MTWIRNRAGRFAARTALAHPLRAHLRSFLLGLERRAPRQKRDPTATSEKRAAVDLDEGFSEVFGAYVASLASAPLAAHTRRTYASKVRQYLVWLADAEVDGDPLASAEGRDWAVRDYLLGVLKRSPATVNGALARWMTSISAAGTGRPK